MKTFSLAFFICVLSACATTANYEQKINSWVGQSEGALISGWGAPEGAYTLSDGSRALSYTDNEGSRSTSSVIGNTLHTRTRSRYCKTTFIVSSGSVVSASSEGSNCRSY